jgi:type IV secretory pathway VirD2 relaxase
LVAHDLRGAILPTRSFIACSPATITLIAEATMAHDDEFEPRLGKIRGTSGKQARTYLQRVLQAAALSGGRSLSARAGRFHGNRIGRGAGVGRVLAARDRYASFRVRRVIIKTRIVKFKGQGLKAAKLHLRYIQRDGVTRDGQPGELYDRASDRADGKSFIERAEGDRHQFRFIVSPEDGAEYEDLKPLVRRLMERMEEDLGTKLDWVAVDHHNTGHPHTHIVLRGRDELDRDLIIAREYITHGMRERAAEIVTLDLGARSDLEIEDRLRLQVEQHRLTDLDRSLRREADADGLVRSGSASADAVSQSLRAGRLQKLAKLGLTEEVAPDHWKLAEDFEATLRRMGERGDIIKTMHREMAAQKVARNAGDYAIYDPADPEAKRIVGRVIARGLSDEDKDRHFVIVDSVDGRTHYIDIGRGDAVEATPNDSIVAIVPKRSVPKAVDRTVADIAAANDGRYSVDTHLRHDPTASATFVETHVRRLEAMRRIGGQVERETDGSWKIAPDHLERAVVFERSQVQLSPVTVESLSMVPLQRQTGIEGATWLDRELVAEKPVALRDLGFGREVRDALTRRRQWLIEQGFAREEQDRTLYRGNMLTELQSRELKRAAGQLSGELGLAYTEARSGTRIEGIYRRHVDLASGRFAVIEKSREFTLVPWRPVLERNLGKSVSGVMRGDAISWTLGHQRGGPTIG